LQVISSVEHWSDTHYGRPAWQMRRLFFCPVSSFLSFFLLFSSPNLSGHRLDVCHTSTHGVAIVQIYNAGLKCGARGSLEMQNPKNRHLGIVAQLCLAVFLQLRHISTIGKNLLDNNISSTCPHNVVNFGPLTAEIGLGVWGTPAHFSGFRILAVLLCGTLVLGVSQTLQH